MNKLRISAVSYTNTKPFVYGLLRSAIPQKVELTLDTPSECAQKLISGQVDIGLVPVAALLHIPDYQIVSDYCIGADGEVNSVFIFSDHPISEVKTLRLDGQSRTSNNLARVLLKNYWKLSPVVVTEGAADAFVEIGDRTFGKKGQFAYAYDLAEEWKNFTGLPFAFAVWASNKPIPVIFIAELNEALKDGLEHRAEVIKNLPDFPGFDLTDYLMEKMSYELDTSKRKALEMFLTLVKAL